ncbi:hypothetical protein MMC24_007658 [Lignoscripta atroalba]|nr:hypothetical protein [Lignoscripta atroalba]
MGQKIVPDSDHEDSTDNQTSGSPTPSPIPARQPAKKVLPRMHKGIDQSNIIPAPTSGPGLARPRKWDASPSPSPERRITRGVTKPDKNVDYDMKHHPMDDVLRPKAASKRVRVSETPEPSVNARGTLTATRARRAKINKVDYNMSHHPMDDFFQPNRVPRKHATPDSFDSSDYSSSSSSTASDSADDQNLFTAKIEADWSEFQPFERRIFLLQKGAPLHGNTLPMKWAEVVRQLIREDYFTRKQFNTWGGEKELKLHYERLRLAMQELFRAEDEPTDRKNWRIYWLEDFDVYDLNGIKATYVHKETPNVRLNDKGKLEAMLPEMPGEVETASGGGTGHLASAGRGYDQGTMPQQFPQAWKADGLDDSFQNNNLMDSLRNDLSVDIDTAIMSQEDVDREIDMFKQKDAADILTKDHATTTTLAEDNPQLLASLDQDTLNWHPINHEGGSFSVPSAIMAAPSDTAKENTSAPAINTLFEFNKKASEGDSYKASLRDQPQNSSQIPLAIESDVMHSSRGTAIDDTHLLDFRVLSKRDSTQIEKEIIDGDTIVLDNALKSRRLDVPVAPEPITTSVDTEVSNQIYNDLNAHSFRTSSRTLRRVARAKASIVGFAIHEDQAGDTPNVKRQIATHPTSPATDIPKENQEYSSDDEVDTTVPGLLDGVEASDHSVQRQEQITNSSQANTTIRLETLTPIRSLFSPRLPSRRSVSVVIDRRPISISPSTVTLAVAESNGPGRPRVSNATNSEWNARTPRRHGPGRATASQYW